PATPVPAENLSPATARRRFQAAGYWDQDSEPLPLHV
ncbi:MAG: hypothetical protein JWM19_3393, partial [Actinomycetia bacterium]|nr:hypothetical protein [Actinomycetes bacterium]